MDSEPFTTLPAEGRAPESPIIEIVKKITPAVITIVVSKDLPKIEGFYLFPFEGQKFAIPKINKGKERTKIGGGSAFIASEDGLVLTACHVVGDPTAEYTVLLEPDEKYLAKVLARDPVTDIAILKIKTRAKLPYLELGDSEQIELGETVIAVGNAFGEFHDTVSTGVISGLSRLITAYSGLTQQATRLRGLIQTDAAINPGNSGGPLVNMEGKAIGINTAVAMGAQNIGFAIPINYAKKVLEEVKKYGKIRRPFLGIRYIILNDEIAKKNKLSVNYGALIVRETLGESAVLRGSAAEKAGLQEYDIILEFRGEKITEENSLSDILQKIKIGEVVTVKIQREGKIMELKVKLGERK